MINAEAKWSFVNGKKEWEERQVKKFYEMLSWKSFLQK